MGKSLSCTINLQAQKLNNNNNNNNNNNRRKKYYKPKSESLFLSPETSKSVSFSTKKKELNLKMENLERHTTQPLSEVVSDCVRRWFQDTLKEAKAGDIGMQVLVGQMYYSGYGVPRDAQKGRAWITKASKSRSSVWKVCDKHPGYNASDSDSDELKDEENGDSTATNN